MQIAPTWMRPIIWCGVLAAAAAYLGNYHILYGSELKRSHIVLRKVSWSLSETVVNLDVLGGLPRIVARAQYPLTLAAMEDYGLIREGR